MNVDGTLRSLNYLNDYEVGLNKARCLSVDKSSFHSDVPSERCSCGIYGVTEPNEFNYYARSIGRYLPVVIECFGKVIIYTAGVRCEYARIIAIIHSRGANQELLYKCQAHYDVPIWFDYQAREILKPYAQITNES
jgi:hypothetical protein